MNFIPQNPMLLLAVATVAFYLAARVGASALDRSGNNPGAAAAAHWLPIAAVVLAAVKSDPQISVSIIFASSVACLTLVIGATSVSSSHSNEMEQSATVAENRAWPMVLPAALLALLAGFRGSFTLFHALLFAIQGCVALMIWTMRSRMRTSERNSISIAVRAMMLVGWIALCLIGATIAIFAMRELAGRIPQLSGAVLAALLLAPALVLPMIGSSMAVEKSHEDFVAPPDSTSPHRAVISLAAGCVLLNLCLLLPLTIVIRRVLAGEKSELIFPISIWRIDTVVLVVLGALLVPISLGKLKIRRLEGVILLAGYALYMSRSVLLAGQ